MGRMRAGVDNKETLARALLRYTKRNQCRPAGFPTTVLLGDKADCEAFFRSNEGKPDSLWFVKASNGSLGRHIRLLRGKDISAMGFKSNGSFLCPMSNRVARCKSCAGAGQASAHVL